jgi:hypothetical protein
MQNIIIIAIICLVGCICVVNCQIVDGDISHIYRRLFVGNYRAGKDIKGLINTYNITAVLNVAWDLDIMYDNYMVPPGYHMIIQANKVGLVDGTGNNIATLASALYVLDQYFLTRDLDDKDNGTYPTVHNVLVHCNKGESRSVVVVALYLYYKSNKFTSFEDALDFVKDKRGLSGDNEVPDPDVLALARQLSGLDVFGFFSNQSKSAQITTTIH